MNSHPIRTKQDYKAALRELSAYSDSEPESGTDDGDRFHILATLVEAQEAKVFLIESPDPIETIRFRTAAGVAGGQGPSSVDRPAQPGL